MSSLSVARLLSQMPMLGRAFSISTLLVVLMPAVARAQGEPSHYGVRVSFAPEWTGEDKYLGVFGLDGTGTIQGTDFTIGFAKGKAQGGEWGVSFIRKPLKTDGIVDFESNDCGPNCSSSFTETSTFNDVYLRGVEVHFSIPFVTIKRRIQAGISLGFGAAFPEGTVHQVNDSSSSFPGFGPNQPAIVQNEHDEFDEPAKDVFFPVVPIIKVEAEVGLLVAPGLKARFGGGLNFPSQKALHVALVYLFGVH